MVQITVLLSIAAMIVGRIVAEQATAVTEGDVHIDVKLAWDDLLEVTISLFRRTIGVVGDGWIVNASRREVAVGRDEA
jgi:hypothetical protein